MPKKEMIRNIDTDFVMSQMEAIGITPKEMCKRLGKGDSYLGAIKRNGMPQKELSVMATWLELDENDQNLYVGGTPLTDDTMEQDTTVTNWSVRDSNELHKMRSDIAQMRRVINRIARKLGVEEVPDYFGEMLRDAKLLDKE